MKVFLDTNVLASALTTRGLCAELFEAVLQSQELLISPAVIQELQRILPGKLGQARKITTDFIRLLRAYATLIEDQNMNLSLPDPDDEVILGAAISAGAHVFVTGDKRLLELSCVQDLKILSPRQFWALLSGRAG